MPTKLKRIDGVPWIDSRETVEEWAKRIGGRWAILCELRMVFHQKTKEPSLLAALRTTNEWEPTWFRVPEDVTYRFSDLKKYSPERSFLSKEKNETPRKQTIK